MALADGGTVFLDRLRRAIRSPLFFALGGLGLVLTGMEIARPHYFLHDDNATFFTGAYAHDFRVLTETGRVAEVNYFQYGGEPFLEQGQTAVLYPPVYVGVALAEWISGDVRWAIDWIAALHLTIGLIGFHFWMRQGGRAAPLAALGALAWVLNPFVLLVGSSWIFVVIVAAWLPWLFWALDRLLEKPSTGIAFVLGAVAGLLFLQGYIQYFAYAVLFLAIYAAIQLVARPETRKPAAIYYLVLAVLVFGLLSLPLLLPMLHAADASAVRSRPLPLGAALYYCVWPDDFLPAQFCLFKARLIFDASSAILYCPALLLIPVAIIRLFSAEAEVRRRLFALVFLGLLAIEFSTIWHWLLTLLPVFDKFRWPFKVYLFADFFLLAALVWTAGSWTESRPARARLSVLATTSCIAVVVLANLVVSLAFHDGNSFSSATLPSSERPLPAEVDAGRGRVIAIDDVVPQTDSSRFLMLGHATLFEVPSLGGYNPLVSPERLHFALGLDFPNVYHGEITPEIRAQLEARAVRYWLVSPNSPQFAQAEAQGGFTTLVADPERVLLEDTRAVPLAFSASDPAKACDVAYRGNSIRVPLRDAVSPLQISLGPTDGWWYRVDRGAWMKPAYAVDHLTVDFAPGSRVLEISYFDPRFGEGLGISALLLAVLAACRTYKTRVSRIRYETVCFSSWQFRWSFWTKMRHF